MSPFHPSPSGSSSSSSTSQQQRVYNVADAQITAPLNVTESKIVVKASFAGEERVLKINITDGQTVQANVLGGQWIRRLGLKNVTAPQMEICQLKAGDLEKVIDQLKPSQSTAIRKEISLRKDDFSKGTASTAAMVSEPARGKTVDELLGYSSTNKSIMTNVIYTAVLDAPEEGSVSKNSYVEKLKKLKESLKRLDQWPPEQDQDLDNLSDGEWLKKQGNFVHNLRTTRNENVIKAKFELQMILAKLGDSVSLTAVENVRTQVKGLKECQNWLKTQEGSDAFIRMACGDLIVGMDDRLLAELNGGNFTFDGDSKQLLCIDNAKRGPDLRKKQEEYETWLAPYQTLAGELAQRLQARLQAMGVNGTNLVTPARVARILREVTTDARKVASQNQMEEGAAEIQERGLYVRDRLQVENKLAQVQQLAPGAVLDTGKVEAGDFALALDELAMALESSWYVPSESQKAQVSHLAQQWSKFEGWGVFSNSAQKKLAKRIKDQLKAVQKARKRSSDPTDTTTSTTATRAIPSDASKRPGQLQLGDSRQPDVRPGNQPQQLDQPSSTATTTITATPSTGPTLELGKRVEKLTLGLPQSNPASNKSTYSGSNGNYTEEARRLWDQFETREKNMTPFPEDATPEQCEKAIELYETPSNTATFRVLLRVVMGIYDQ